MSDSTNTFIQGYEVALPAIEKELVKFWKNVAGEEDAAVTRATTMNFIYLGSEESEMDKAATMVADIIQHHPARILLININLTSKQEKITAHVNAYCQPPQHGGKQICCEQITLQTGQPGIAHLSGAILPLLLPDLPVFLFCPQPDILARKEFSALLQLVNRTILESTPHCGDFASAVEKAKLLLKLHNSARLSDTAWGGLTMWREALAQFFDNLPTQAATTLSRVTISASGEGLLFSSVLLLFWLASRLQWKFTARQEKNQILFVNGEGRQIVGEFGEDRKAEDEGISKIVLEFGKANEGQLVCYREKDRMVIQWNLGGETAIINTFDNIHISREKLVCDELDFLGEDIIFIETLKAIASTIQD